MPILAGGGLCRLSIPLLTCVTLDKELNLSELFYKMGSAHLLEILWGWNKVVHAMQGAGTGTGTGSCRWGLAGFPGALWL